jgi:hypothetical protein
MDTYAYYLQRGVHHLDYRLLDAGARWLGGSAHPFQMPT